MSDELVDIDKETQPEAEEDARCPCPETFPDWDGKTINLGGYCTHEMRIASFFHMPISYDLYVYKQAANVHHLELTEKWPDFLMTRTGMWGGSIMRLIEDSDSPSRLVNYLPEPFFVQVELHHGGVGTVPKAVHKMQIEMIEKGQVPKVLYLAHLTCHMCEERKGGEKILILRKFIPNERIKLRLKEERLRDEEKKSKNAEKEKPA